MSAPTVSVRVPKATRPRRTAVVIREALIVGVFFSVAIAGQTIAGAFHGERSAFPDEASHFMNGLLVRDYLTTGLGQNPLRFAEHYYVHYPKIAPVMWPPLFAGTLGLTMLPKWPPQIAALALLSSMSAWAAWRLYRFVLTFDTRIAAVTVALMLGLTPAIVNLSTAVMMDLVLAAISLEAAHWLARFVCTGKTTHALLFGGFAALACLTKGNGLSLALMPPVLLALTGRLDLFRRPALWVAAGIVVAFAGPPLALSFRLDSAIGDFGALRPADILRRAVFYASHVERDIGLLAFGLAAIGFLSAAWHARDAHGDDAAIMKAALAALVAAGVAFHLLSPVLSVSSRYIALIFPPVLGLLPVGIRHIGRLTGLSDGRGRIRHALLAAAVVVFLVTRPALASRLPIGAGQTIDDVEARSGLAGTSVLIVSDNLGEGAMVSEVARRHPVPEATVIRGTKLIAHDDWSGHNFRMLYESPAALLQDLEDLHVDFLVVDYSPDAAAVPFWGLVHDLVVQHGDRLEMQFSTTTARRLVTYRLRHHSPGPAKRLEIPLTYSLGRALVR